MSTDSNQYPGFATLETFEGDYNKLRFVIQQQMHLLNTSMPVEVLSVNATGVNPVGHVGIRILVDQVTGDDIAYKHSEIPNVPYFRLQGGANAVIIDPKVGDIGLACFCSRDISSVKNSRKSAPPGSRRSYDFSDAMYIGGFLNGTPIQYIHFTDGGIVIHSPGNITANAGGDVLVNAGGSAEVTAGGYAAVNAPSTTINSETTINGSLLVNGNLAAIGTMTNNGVNIGSTHTHPDVEKGPYNTGAPQ